MVGWKGGHSGAAGVAAARWPRIRVNAAAPAARRSARTNNRRNDMDRRYNGTVVSTADRHVSQRHAGESLGIDHVRGVEPANLVRGA